jgi:uncharacterized protein (DUF302 family)
MKKIFFSFIVVTFLLSCQAKAQNGFHKIKSNYSVDGTVEKLTGLLTAKGMKIFATIDHQKGALQAGLDLRPTTLVIFGNPKVGTMLMQCDQRIGLALPLKMLIWQDENGSTWIGYWQPSNLNIEYNLEGCEETIKKVKMAMGNFAQGAAS